MTTRPTSGADLNCLLCHGPKWTLLYRSDDKEYHCKPGTWDIVQCDQCGHVCLHPIPEWEEVASLYPNTYYTVNRNSPLFSQGNIYEKKLVYDAKKLRRQMRNEKITSIIDIGCGDVKRVAAFKDAFADAGASATAFDILFNDTAKVTAKQRGVEVLEGNIETDVSALPDGGYDLALMRQLFEHLRDPRKALQNLRPKLKKGALVIIDTPNVGGLDYKLFKDSYWGGYHMPRHFHLFTQPSLCKIVEEAGFRIEDKGYLPSIGFWIISLRVKYGLDCAKTTRSFWEWITIKNIPLAGTFTVLDLLRIKLGLQTSNHFVVARKTD